MVKELKAREYKRFEDIKQLREDGTEFWSARELAPALEYIKWENFHKVIRRAMLACENSGRSVDECFPEVRKTSNMPKGGTKPMVDYELTRYACYLIVQNGDPRKEAIALGQTYFAIQTYRQEAAEFEVAELISISRDKKVIVDTNIPLDILKEISDYNHVAVMLSPQSMSAERFFDRSDPEKQFLLSVIESCEDHEAVMENYRRGLTLINSKKHYDEYANSGFFTVVREDNGKDTREEVCDIIAKHSGLI